MFLFLKLNVLKVIAKTPPLKENINIYKNKSDDSRDSRPIYEVEVKVKAEVKIGVRSEWEWVALLPYKIQGIYIFNFKQVYCS